MTLEERVKRHRRILAELEQEKDIVEKSQLSIGDRSNRPGQNTQEIVDDIDDAINLQRRLIKRLEDQKRS